MDYPELAKLFHMDASSDRHAANQAECARRKAMDSTFKVQIYEDADELFIAMPREMLVLMEKVLRAERKSVAMMQALPPIARAALVRGLVLDEVVSTNAIEDINSTRQQIEEALEAERCGDVAFRRFKELALLYMGLSEGAAVSLPTTPEDIRGIYDVIMEGELDDSKKPDGELFRKEGVDITAGGVKVIHCGAPSEARIIEGLNSMLKLTACDDVPSLISAIASHYVFENIHPFYDGNGRTGRYLLALFLNEVLSAPTVLSLSRAISENKHAYYSAFSSVENPLNHGEMTHFVYAMLELIRIAQSSTMERLQKSSDRFSVVANNCSKYFEKNDLSKKEQEIVFVLARFDLFGMVGSMLLEEIAEHIELSKQMTRKHLKGLEDKGVVEVVAKKPLRFALTKKIESLFGITEFERIVELE